MLPRIHRPCSRRTSLLAARTDVCGRGRCWQSVHVETIASKEPHCQDCSLLTQLSLALSCPQGVPGDVSSLVNMEHEAGTQSMWQADCWGQSLRFPSESEGGTGGVRVQLLLSQVMSTPAHMSHVFLAPLALRSSSCEQEPALETSKGSSSGTVLWVWNGS